jgi:hypothetical protein
MKGKEFPRFLFIFKREKLCGAITHTKPTGKKGRVQTKKKDPRTNK